MTLAKQWRNWSFYQKQKKRQKTKAIMLQLIYAMIAFGLLVIACGLAEMY